METKKWLTKTQINREVENEQNACEERDVEFPAYYTREHIQDVLIPSMLHRFFDDWVSIYLQYPESLVGLDKIGVDEEHRAYLATLDDNRKRYLSELNDEEFKEVWLDLTLTWGMDEE